MHTTFEDLIDELGGLGRFQILVTACIISCQFTVGWSMLQMSFAGMIPDFNCLTGLANDSSYSNDSLNVCSVNGTSCTSYVFHGVAKTVVSEWDLLCDNLWQKSTITSVQMFGVLVGALSAGQLSDLFGRRKALYSFVFLHIVFNFVAAFSTSWVMFTAIRFFIGIGIGAIVVVVFPYPMEFLPLSWRPVLSVIPSWTLGVALFSAACLTLNNWSHLHIACGVLSIPSLLGCLFVPESIRWLAVHGRLKDAEAVFEKIARLNRKPLPKDTRLVLQRIINKERESRESGRKYSYIDIFRGWQMTKISLILWFFWFTLATVFYGISFGVADLSGNIYLNIFLLAIMELPVQTTTFWLNNRFGRRLTSFGFYLVSALTGVGCLLSQLFADEDSKGIWINVFSLTAKMFVGAAWSCTQTWGSELYPTVTRNLGYGFSNMGARIGGILSPFLINLSDRVTISYSIMTSLLIVCTLLVLVVEDTKGLLLTDSIHQRAEEAGADNERLDGVGSEDEEGSRVIYKGPKETGLPMDADLNKTNV